MAQMGMYSSGVDMIPGVDSPFFSTIVLFKNRIAVSPGVLMVSWKEIRIPGFRMGMDVSPRNVGSDFQRSISNSSDKNLFRPFRTLFPIFFSVFSLPRTASSP